MKLRHLIAFVIAWFSVWVPVCAMAKNGFDLSNAVIPEHEIKRGGPPRDGIVALTSPTFVAAVEAEFVRPDERVLGVVVADQAKAYPLRMLAVHEIVNDVVGQQHFAVTYCPLCGTGIVFAANLPGTGALNFGVSGLLYNSDLLMYDRNTESLWSQISATAVAGPLVGVALPRLPVWHTTWRDWLATHPHSVVMQGSPRFKAMYRRDLYPGYARSKRLYFDVSHRAPREYHPKEFVLGVEIAGQFKAYPFSELVRYERAEFLDTVGGLQIEVVWDADNQSAEARSMDGGVLVSTMSYWFAWYTFHPETHVFRAVPSSAAEAVR